MKNRCLYAYVMSCITLTAYCMDHDESPLPKKTNYEKFYQAQQHGYHTPNEPTHNKPTLNNKYKAAALTILALGLFYASSYYFTPLRSEISTKLAAANQNGSAIPYFFIEMPPLYHL